MKPIYLDSNATSPMLPSVWEAMQPFYCDKPGNPSSSHRFGRQARQALEDARESIAALLGALPEEVLFTSGATEANILAIFGLLADRPPGTIAASPIEHPCILEPIRILAERGFTQVAPAVSSEGVVDPATVPNDVRLAALMLANHETGAIQPVQQLAGRVPVHCDAAAAAGKMLIDFHALGVKTLSISAHKFHGPKGIGALLIRKGVKLKPTLYGGHQQQAMRPGTEPVALAVGMAAALAWSMQNLDANRAKLVALRKRLLALLESHAAPVLLNGPREGEGGLPHTLNVAFPGCRADVLMMRLDLEGVACSTGSACSSGSLLPSPVLRAMGKTGDALHGALRISLSALLSDADIEEAGARIGRCVQELRSVSDAD